MRPTVASDHGLVGVRWPEPYFLAFDFDLFRAERGGEVTAEVLVRSTALGAEDRLHQARVNLTSTRSRSELANTLKRRHPLDEWDRIIEGTAMLVLRTHRDAEPAILLRDAQRPPDAGWLLPPLVLGRLPTILFGDGGTGKSYLALAAALSIHTDQALLGIAPTSTRTVAYLDFELEAYEQRARMRQLLGEQEPDIVYRRCTGALRDQVEPLRRMVREYGIGFVVVDSVGPACGGPPEDAAVALGFFEALRSLEVGALCVAHVNRQGDTRKPFGSSFWHNGARATWYAKRVDEGEGSVSVGLFNRKSNVGPLAAPMGYRLSFTDGQVAVERTDIADVAELAPELPIRARMIRLLSGGPLLLHEIAEELDVTVEAVRSAAKRHQGRTFTTVTGPDERERWALLESRR